MSSLGDVLELTFGRPSAEGVAVHAVAREWQDEAVAERVAECFRRTRRKLPMPWLVRVQMIVVAPLMAVDAVRRLVARIGPGRESPPPETQLTLSLGAGGRARVERSWTTAAGGVERRVAIVRLGDDTAWTPDARGGPWPTPTTTDVDRLFDRRLLLEILASLYLESTGEDEVAGRPVVVARAERRGHQGPWPHWLPYGADDYELRLDREHGHLLGFRARADGHEYAGLEVTEITYGFDPART